MFTVLERLQFIQFHELNYIKNLVLGYLRVYLIPQNSNL